MMKSNLILKFLSISLLTLFLFSCGISSNGVFDKRKHTKGWHFNKKKSFLTTKSESNDTEDFKIKKSENESESAFVVSEKIDTKDLSDAGTDIKTKSLVKENSKLSQPRLLKKEKPIDDNFHDSELSKSESARSPHQKNPIEETNNRIEQEKTTNPNITTSDPRDGELPYLYDPFRIILGLLGLYFIFGFIIGLIIFILFLLALADASVFIVVPLMVILGYIVFSFLVYRILLLFRREDEIEIWSLKKTFANIGLIFIGISVIALVATLGIDFSF